MDEGTRREINTAQGKAKWCIYLRHITEWWVICTKSFGSALTISCQIQLPKLKGTH